MNEKSSVIHLYCKGLHFICFTVGLPLVYMTMLINCEGPICRCWRVRHMWLQTANHAGGSVPAQHTTACNTIRSECTPLCLCFTQIWKNSTLTACVKPHDVSRGQGPPRSDGSYVNGGRSSMPNAAENKPTSLMVF